jgi:hypothetical protein
VINRNQNFAPVTGMAPVKYLGIIVKGNLNAENAGAGCILNRKTSRRVLHGPRSTGAKRLAAPVQRLIVSGIAVDKLNFGDGFRRAAAQMGVIIYLELKGITIVFRAAKPLAGGQDKGGAEE